MKLLLDMNPRTAMRLTALAIALVFCMGMFSPMVATVGSAEAWQPTSLLGYEEPSEPLTAEPQPEMLAAPEPVEPNTIIIQPNGAVGKDTYIASGLLQDNNYGGEATLVLGTDGTNNFKGLVQFTLPAKIASIRSATLSLFCNQIDFGTRLNVSVEPVSASWSEGDGTNFLDATWLNRNTGTPWATAGGVSDSTQSSYQVLSNRNVWHHWNVTPIVTGWNSGTPNNGFMLNWSSVSGPSWVIFYTSDEPNLKYHPKLTISYSAEITTPVGAQVFQEDDPARNIPLSGRGNGTVEHISDTPTTSNPIPFWGSSHDKVFHHNLYNSTQVGCEGTIRRIGFDRSNPTSPTEGAGLFQNLRISMAHTTKTVLSSITFDSNYHGSLIEVFHATNVYINSSNGDSWIYFDLNKNFTYDSQYNLLVNISWDQDGGTDVRLKIINTGAGCRAYSLDGVSSAVTNSLVTKFFVDAADNGAFDKGTVENGFLFPAASDYTRFQMLYNATLLGNQSGLLDLLQFYKVDTDSGSFYNLTIKVAHTDKSDLSATFSENYIGTLTTVFYRANFTFEPYPYWVEFDVEDVFFYDGARNLLVEIEWRGVPIITSAIGLVRYPLNSGAAHNWTYTRTLGALTGTVDTRIFSMQAIFADSTNLTWSASSSDVSKFTASVTGRTLTITPLANANGAGVVHLTLTNAGGGSVTQNIPVIITAVNDAPILAALATIQCVEDVPYALNITASITDIDDVMSDITVTTTSNYDTIVGRVITFLYPEGVLGETVTVTVTDKGGLKSIQPLVTRVTMINDKPQFTGFISNITCDATVPSQLSLTATDEETPTGHLTISSASQYANVSGHSVRLLYPKGIGTDQVTIVLSDNLTYGTQNNVSYQLNVIIIDHPEVSGYWPRDIDVPVTTFVRVAFDMPMNMTKVENAFSMRLGTTYVVGNFTWDTPGTVLNFTPASHLTNGLYVVRIAASAESTDGITMLGAFEWNFTAALGSFDGDGDGMPDQWELDNGLDPDADDADGDADYDGMPNLYEYENGLDPSVNDANADLDGDGMPNIYEYANNLDPGVNDADGDADNDGYTNFEEYEAGTDPNDPDSSPASYTWIILLILVVAVVAVLLLVMMLMKRGKKPAPEPQFQEGNYPPPPPPPGFQPEAPLPPDGPMPPSDV
jgi:hypothetical protein